MLFDLETMTKVNNPLPERSTYTHGTHSSYAKDCLDLAISIQLAMVQEDVRFNLMDKLDIFNEYHLKDFLIEGLKAVKTGELGLVKDDSVYEVVELFF